MLSDPSGMQTQSNAGTNTPAAAKEKETSGAAPIPRPTDIDKGSDIGRQNGVPSREEQTVKNKIITESNTINKSPQSTTKSQNTTVKSPASNVSKDNSPQNVVAKPTQAGVDPIAVVALVGTGLNAVQSSPGTVNFIEYAKASATYTEAVATTEAAAVAAETTTAVAAEATVGETILGGIATLFSLPFVLTASFVFMPQGGTGNGSVPYKPNNQPKEKFLYRFDTRSPTEIINQGGFKSWGNNEDLLEHALGISTHEVYPPNSAFISTSKDWTALIKTINSGTNGYIYTIKWQQMGRDVNAELGSKSPHPEEQEIAVPYFIPAYDIKFVLPYKQP